ncbi:MAG: DUF4159 domain-containing protein [Vicinamibacterales bacterium]
MVFIRSRRLLLAALVLVSSAAYAQRGGGGYYGVRRPNADTFKGDFTFCRLAFRSAYGGYGGGWGVDYPRADENLSIRLSELSEAVVNFDRHGTPNYVVIQATEPELFKCPFLALTNHGRALFTEEEVVPLRAYLKKGGFLWADDAWGSYAWDHWLGELRKILPASEYPLVDLPVTHAIFRTLFEAKRIPQIPNIGFFTGSGGQTSEQGEDSRIPHAYALVDSSGRIVVLTTHNTDFGDAYEREADDPAFFYRFSVEGYAIGINILLYSMTY